MSLKKPTPEELQAFRERLVRLRSRLRGDISAITDNALNKNTLEGGEATVMPIHMADIGSDNFEQEFSLSLMMSGRDRLEEIDAAIARIDDGVYGLCAKCGVVIPNARLNAIPFTAFCVKCAGKGKR
ncbi:MAG TPA: transcriptional regulator [Planctomycetaceae bacterium]|nr:transcriptional regulator [Planctomycetaceae bacterium]